MIEISKYGFSNSVKENFPGEEIGNLKRAIFDSNIFVSISKEVSWETRKDKFTDSVDRIGIKNLRIHFKMRTSASILRSYTATVTCSYRYDLSSGSLFVKSVKKSNSSSNKGVPFRFSLNPEGSGSYSDLDLFMIELNSLVRTNGCVTRDSEIENISVEKHAQKTKHAQNTHKLLTSGITFQIDLEKKVEKYDITEDDLKDIKRELFKTPVKVYIEKKVSWLKRVDRFSKREINTGIKRLFIVLPWEDKFLKIMANFSYSFDEENGGIYIWNIIKFNHPVKNGVNIQIVKTSKEIELEDFMENVESFTEIPGLTLKFEDTKDITYAMDLYQEIVNKVEKESSCAIETKTMIEKSVRQVDYASVPDDLKKIVTKLSKGHYVEEKDLDLLPVDSYSKSKFHLLSFRNEGINYNVSKILRRNLMNRQDLQLSDKEEIKITDENFLKYFDFKVERAPRKKRRQGAKSKNTKGKDSNDSKKNNEVVKESKSTITKRDESPVKGKGEQSKKLDTLHIITGEFADPKTHQFLHIFDRLSRIRANTVFHAIKQIKKGRVNNNNLFQYLFNNGDISNIGRIDGHVVNHWNPTTPLNEEQQEAFNHAIRDFPITFIQGPPGTGKTHIITELCKYFNDQNKNVLLSSQTNVAVENILEKLVDDTEFQDAALKVESSKTDRKKFTLNTYENVFKEKIMKLMNWKDIDFKGFDIAPVIKETRIIGSTTTSSAVKRNNWPRFVDKLDVLIIDEISKSSVPELIRYSIIAKKLIFVGDHRQLPPLDEFDEETIEQYDENDKRIIKEYIDVSIFDKLYKNMDLHGHAFMLKENYRSVRTVLNQYSSFYNNELRCNREDSSSKIEWKSKEMSPFTFYNVLGARTEVEKGGHSRKNIIEAEQIAKELIRLGKSIKNSKELTVAVIGTYGAQVGELSRRIKREELKNKYFKDVKIDTVDSFQGDQADIVILSTVITGSTMKGHGFLKDYRRLNVAISRAKDLLLVFGNRRYLRQIEYKLGGEIEKSIYFFKEIFNNIGDEGMIDIDYEKGGE